MSGLSGLTQNTGTQTTSLPSWYTAAQQDVVNQAGTANAAAPAPQSTVAQNAVNALSGPTNAFTTAGSTLQGIASGAANPWITDASGNVTPNTNTALGGLFQAQDQQLNQLLPNATAPVEGANIAAGQFGSLRGETAVDKAKTDAQASLLSSQMQAALQNQATGVNAGSAAGNVAQQNINNLLTTGQYQQAAPFTNAANYGNVLSTVQPGSTIANTTNLSPLNQIGGLLTALTGANGTTGILNQLGVTGGLSGLVKSIGSAFGIGGGSSGSGLTLDPSVPGGISVGTYPLADGGTIVINSDGTRTINKGDGTVVNENSDGTILNTSNATTNQNQQENENQSNGGNSSDTTTTTDTSGGSSDSTSYDATNGALP